MDVAILRATRIPIASAKGICAALKQAKLAVTLMDRHLLTVVVGGAFIMKGAVDAVLLNVDANVAYVSDDEMSRALQQARIELRKLCAGS